MRRVRTNDRTIKHLICYASCACSCFQRLRLAQFPSPTYGWNLGNTLEPPCGEGCWAPAATQAMINAVADAGFNSIRIPVAWDSHANQTTHVIDPTWLKRVKQVVDWSFAADLTVVINTHWDGGWLENNIGDTVNPTINAKMNAYWTQIANTFASYDERLLFAAANEPNADTAAEMSTLLAYEQTFVNAVPRHGRRQHVSLAGGPGAEHEHRPDRFIDEHVANSTRRKTVWPLKSTIMTPGSLPGWAKMQTGGTWPIFGGKNTILPRCLAQCDLGRGRLAARPAAKDEHQVRQPGRARDPG